MEKIANACVRKQISTILTTSVGQNTDNGAAHDVNLNLGNASITSKLAASIQAD